MTLTPPETMADEEMDTDALLKDLESRSSSSAAAAASSDGEGEGPDDIEAFLRDLEGEEYVPPAESSTKTAEKDPLEDEFAGLEEAPDAPVEKAPDKKSKKKEKKKKEKGEVQVVERGESQGLKWAGRIAKWSVVLIPMLAAGWVLGAYLGQWVSAGWLIFSLATVVVVGVPIALRVAVKRGRFIWWAAGFSALLAVGLVAPLTAPAGKALARYGHWPATALASVAGWDSDHILVRANESISGWVSQLVHPTQEEQDALQLGGDEPLAGEKDADSDAKPDETDATPDGNADAKPDETDTKPDEKPDETKPDETADTKPDEKPDETKPDETKPDEKPAEEPDETKPDEKSDETKSDEKPAEKPDSAEKPAADSDEPAASDDGADSDAEPTPAEDSAGPK